MLLELVDSATRLCPVAGIVHAGRDLVHDQRVAGDEKLDPHHADIIELVQDFGRKQNRIGALVVGDRGGHQRRAQDAALMLVLARIEAGDRAILGARADHGNLLEELHEAFEDRGRALHFLQRGGGLFGRVDHNLTLAVIAEAASFQDRGAADLGNCLLQVLDIVHGGERCGGEAQIVEEGFLDQTVLTDGQRLAVRADRLETFQQIERRGRHVLEFIGDDVHGLGEGAQRGFVLIGRGGHRMGHVARGRVRARLEDMGLVAQTRGRDREHPAQLTAAEDADHRSIGQGLTHLPAPP